MKTELINRKIIGLFLALIPTITIVSNISEVKAQSVSEENPISQAQDINQLNWQLDTQPVVPENLEQSEKPFEGRAVVGFDERIQMTSRKYPWSAIGRIQGVGVDGGGYACTGTLLAPDIVLTNAHCVVNPETHQVSQQIWFQPNLVYGTLQDQGDMAFVVQFAYGTDFTNANGADPNDWAILKLDRPVGNKYGTLPWSSLPTGILADNREQFALVGYSGDFPEYSPGETAGVHIGCSILGEENGLYIHDCDTNGGASGGPIIGLIDGKFQIVGLHAGALRFSDGTVVNYAVKMSRLDELLNRNRQ